MGEGHIPVTAIAEMIRVVKKGGTVVIVMREEYLTYVKDYVDKLEPYMKDLEDKGFWKQVRLDICSNYNLEMESKSTHPTLFFAWAAEKSFISVNTQSLRMHRTSA